MIDEVSNEGLPVLEIGDDVGDEIEYGLSKFKDSPIVGLALIENAHKESFDHDHKLFLLDKSAFERRVTFTEITEEHKEVIHQTSLLLVLADQHGEHPVHELHSPSPLGQLAPTGSVEC